MMSCNVLTKDLAQMEFKAVSRKISTDLQFSTLENCKLGQGTHSTKMGADKLAEVNKHQHENENALEKTSPHCDCVRTIIEGRSSLIRQ
jgi:hypothetical protein